MLEGDAQAWHYIAYPYCHGLLQVEERESTNLTWRSMHWTFGLESLESLQLLGTEAVGLC